MDDWTEDQRNIYDYVCSVHDTAIVNGDDMLFRSDDELYQYFMVRSSQCGFVPSAGKNYSSDKCAMINSQIFRVVSGVVKREGYLNLRLIEGNFVKTGGNNNPLMITKELNKMTSLCNWTASTVKYPLKKWDKFFPEGRKPSYYLPPHLGGYGLDSRFAKKLKLTTFQRSLANHYVHNNFDEQLFVKPTPKGIRELVKRVNGIFNPLYQRVELRKKR